MDLTGTAGPRSVRVGSRICELVELMATLQPQHDLSRWRAQLQKMCAVPRADKLLNFLFDYCTLLGARKLSTLRYVNHIRIS